MLVVVGAAPAFAQDEMFVTNATSITVYARTANGNVAPVRTLAGAATGLNFPVGVAVDLVNNELIVANAGNDSVTVYARTASGNTAPLRTIGGPITGLNHPDGLALDLVNNELVVANALGNSITVHARTADGNVAPVRTLVGGATGLSSPVVPAVDAVNNELFVSNAGDTSVTVYARTANGDTAPLRTLAGAATGLALPIGVAVDTVNNELVVVNSINGSGGNSVTVYSRTADGDVAPLRKISGAATGLCGPAGLAVDLVNNELAVANPNKCGKSVVVFARTANGDVAPVRTLFGTMTGLDVPEMVAITNGAPPPPLTLDIDASLTSTKYDALTDGLLVMRYLFGLTGTALTNGAVGGTATRSDPTAIKTYLDARSPRLDIDDSGTADALTDGLLVIRYLFGLRGSSLIAGAVDPLAKRKTAADIEAYLQTLLP